MSHLQHQPISPRDFEKLLEDVQEQLHKDDSEKGTSWEAYLYGDMIKELYPLLFMLRIEVRSLGGPSGYANLLALAAAEKALLELQIPLQKEIENAERRAKREEEKQQAERDARQAEREQGDDA